MPFNTKIVLNLIKFFLSTVDTVDWKRTEAAILLK